MEKATSRGDVGPAGVAEGARERKQRITFLHLGSGVAFGGFVKGVARAARLIKHIDCAFIVAAERPLAEQLAQLDAREVSVPAVVGLNPILFVTNFLLARRLILSFLRTEKPDL